jgi:small subunit ribosomal protein S21
MVVARENESLENLIARFNKFVDKEGILTDWREHEYFIKPSAKRHEHDKKKKREFKKLRRSI